VQAHAVGRPGPKSLPGIGVGLIMGAFRSSGGPRLSWTYRTASAGSRSRSVRSGELGLARLEPDGAGLAAIQLSLRSDGGTWAARAAGESMDLPALACGGPGPCDPGQFGAIERGMKRWRTS